MSISILRDFENALLVAEFHSVQTARGMSHLLLRGSSGHFSWPGSLVLCGYMILNELNDVKWILHQFTIMNPLCHSKFLNDPEPYFLWMGMKNETVHLTLQISSNIYKNVSSWFPPGIYLATKWRKSIQRLAIKCYTQTRGAALMLPIVLRPGGSQHHIWPQCVPCVCRKISWRSDWQYDSSTMYFVIPQGSPAIWLLVATVALFDQKVSISSSPLADCQLLIWMNLPKALKVLRVLKA